MNDHSWLLSDLQSVPKNGVTVMSTFACGGGSSLGYKLAGCDVIAANDIDPEMARHYKKNLNPRHYFLRPIKDLMTDDLPPELFSLDILDGSPPCSTFTMAGRREEGWGKNKHFREGQAKQVLSDLFFDYLDLVGRLKPKVAIAENVKGMLVGNAKGYVKMIVARFRELGYRPQVFLINAADCGVPQRRERVFFCAVRDDIAAPKLELKPFCKWVSAEDACSDVGDLTPTEIKQTRPSPEQTKWWPLTAPGKNFADTRVRLGLVSSSFNRIRLAPDVPVNTITATSDDLTHWSTCRKLTTREFIRLGSFPDDYSFASHRMAHYLIGMSVPPKMIGYIAAEVCGQWLGVKS